MDIQNGSLPGVFKDIQGSLKPYIKKRKEIACVRRVLTCQLNSHLNEQQHLSRPLSLIDASHINSTTHGIRGLQKDYIRALQINTKARNAYATLQKDLEHEQDSHSSDVDLITPRHDFLNLIRARQKHERLWIIQDYVETLGQKAPASKDHLDSKVAMKDVESQPPMPSEILNVAGAHRRPVGEDLHELVDRLEKAVLRAKMLLKREQKLLVQIQTESSQRTTEQGSRADALGITRNELIIWIETELSRAGDSPSEYGETPPTPSQQVFGKGHLQSQLESSKLHYSRYIMLRKDLITATEGCSATTTYAGEDEHTNVLPSKELSSYSNSLMRSTAPYLEELVYVTNEQKAMIQQKAHVAVTLAKQLKEAGQGLDRLADESHLLPSHPLPKTTLPQVGLGAPMSFGDEISMGEKPDLSRRAQAWVFATASADGALKDIISERLDEGGIALLEAQESLLELLGFLGNDVEVAQDGLKEDLTDIWAVLNGKLGVI